MSAQTPSTTDADGHLEPSRRKTRPAGKQHQKKPRHSPPLSAWTVARWRCQCTLSTRTKLPQVSRRNPHGRIHTTPPGRTSGQTPWRAIASMDCSLGPGHPGCHEGGLASSPVVLNSTAQHFILAALRRGNLPQVQEQHPEASHHRDEQGLAK